MNQLTPSVLQSTGLKYPDSVAHLIARCLQRHGIEVLFGQSLPTMLHLACEELGLKQVAYRTENAGGYMADAHARLTRRPSVVTAQNGPAATLLVAPLAEALKVSIPLIALVQDVGRAETDRNAFQDFDHMARFSSCAKWVRRVTEAARGGDYIDQAFAAACSGRPGPVVLMLPADLLVEPAPPARRLSKLGHFPLDRTVAAPDAIRLAAELLARAASPLVIAGGGVHISGAHDVLAALQEAAHLPVATTVMGKGSVDETHPLSLGVVGYFMGPNGATRHLRPLVEQADVVLLVGNRTNQNGTDSWTLLPRGATYIHIDIDEIEIGRNYESLRLKGDAKLTLRALNEALAREDLATRRAARPWLERTLADAREKHLAEIAHVTRSDASPIRPERFMAELEKQLADDHIVVADASFSSIWVANYLAATHSRRFITPRGQAGLGWGFPMALGARIGQPARPVFCVVGDGGFGHVWAELETARRHGIRVVVAVMNNGILGYQKHAEDAGLGRHTDVCDFVDVDHAAIARACGVKGLRLERAADIASTIAEALATDGPVLIDVIADPSAMPPVTVFTKLADY